MAGGDEVSSHDRNVWGELERAARAAAPAVAISPNELRSVIKGREARGESLDQPNAYERYLDETDPGWRTKGDVS